MTLAPEASNTDSYAAAGVSIDSGIPELPRPGHPGCHRQAVAS